VAKEVLRADDARRTAVLRRSPLVHLEEDFVDLAEREHVIRLGAAAETAGLTGAKHDSTGFSFELATTADERVAALARRIADRTGLAPPSTLRFRRYRGGEWHPRHVDHFEIDGDWLLVTAMVVLRAPEAGGATSFPHATPRLRVPATGGALILWLNHLRDGCPDRLAGHEGELVTQGEKITVTAFQYGPRRAAADLWTRFDV
jgi:hypothetical protein